MAGYDYQAGMSNNAVEAYDRGVKPISSITRQDLDQAGLDIPIAFARWLAKQGHWSPAEWHHSGGTWYNEVEFYDPVELAAVIAEEGLDISALRGQWKSSAGQPKTAGARVRGSYAEFGGTRRRPRFVGDVAFTGTLAGDWIHLDGGGKKRADGRHITWSQM